MAIEYIRERYNDQQHLTLYNKGISGAQENGKFSCKKLLNYLVISNILLLSLSLSLAHRR